MTSSTTKNGWIRIAIITAGGLAILPFSPGFKQQRNMRLAAAQADKLKPILQADPRFKHLQAEVSTGNGGSLRLFGFVDREEDKLALAKLLADSKPPVPVSILILKPQSPGGKEGTDPSPAPIHANGD